MPERSAEIQRNPEHERLDVFVGQWAMEGRQLDGPFGPAAAINATQTYEWLQGGHFLILRFEGAIGDAPAGCIEITGYDAITRTYPTNTFYNDGKKVEWHLREHKGTWIRTGAWQQSGKTTRVRCTTLFSEDRNSLTGKWEHSINGSAWQLFWDIKAVRL